MKARDYIDSLASAGRYHVSLEAVVSAIGANPTSVRSQLRRLKGRGLIAEPV